MHMKGTHLLFFYCLAKLRIEHNQAWIEQFYAAVVRLCGSPQEGGGGERMICETASWTCNQGQMRKVET